MVEILLNNQSKEKQIAMLENGKLVEYYIDEQNSARKEGNIYVGIVKNVIKGMQAAFVDIGTEKNSFIHSKDLLPKIDEKKEKVDTNIDIKDIVKSGEKILVQVQKDSNAQKGARVSKHIILPSRYIVFMPNTDIVTISLKIKNKNEQERLINLVKANLSKGNGAVIRTSAEGKNEEIIEDIKRIEKKWSEINKKFNNYNDNKPTLIAKADSILEKMIIDIPKENIKSIITNDKKEYNTLKEDCNLNVLYKEKNIFDLYDIENDIKKIQNRKVWLKCGGFITIDKTEALTAIDVNTGKYTGNTNIENTIYKVNKEATIEIAKQLRLRDIGGIIIIDYIDMKNEEHKNKIKEILEEELKQDRAKTQIEGFTKLDLMELTRKHICSHKE